MKYLKYSLRLFVPIAVLYGLSYGISSINWSDNNYPSFAGFHTYMQMLFEPDIFHVILLNMLQELLIGVCCASVLYVLYGFLREKLHRVNELAVYVAIWLVTAVSVGFTTAYYSTSSYPAFTIVSKPNIGERALNSAIWAAFFATVAVFIVWVAFKLIMKYKTAHSSAKPAKNNTVLLSVGTALMCVYTVLHFANGLIRTLLVLSDSNIMPDFPTTLRIIFNANWLGVAAAVVAVVILVKLISGKQPAKGLYISLIVLSSLVLLRSLTVGNAFNTLYIETSNISLILKVLTVVFKTVSGAFIDTVASVMLIIASVRVISQENAEPLPKHQITAALSKTLGITAIVVVAMIILSVLFSIFITFADGNSGSIGIIGGADGPTAWFITQTLILGSFGTHLISCLCLAVASIVLKIVSNKQKAEA